MSTPLPVTALDTANALAALGISTVPVIHRTKRPPIKWTPFQTRVADVSERFEWFHADRYSLAVVAGASDNLLPLDYDGPNGFESHAAVYPVLRTYPRIRTGSGKVHVWIRTAAPVKFYKTTAPDGSVLEVRGGAHITVCPPSRHPSGGSYTWEVPPWAGIPIVELASIGLEARPVSTAPPSAPVPIGDRLPPATRGAIAAALVEHWRPTYRKDLTLAVAGWLAHHGTPEQDAQAVLAGVVTLADDDSNQKEMARWITGTYTKVAKGEAVAGWAALTDATRPLVSPATATSLDHLIATRAAIKSDTHNESDTNVVGVPILRDTSREVERWRAAYHRIRCIAQRRHAHSLAVERELAQLHREIAHPAYRGRVHIVEGVAQTVAISRPAPDGSTRLVKEDLAAKLGTGVGTLNATLAPAIACGAVVERVVTTYDKEKRQPTTACYLDFPGLTRSDDPNITRSRVRAQLLTAPAVRRTGKTGKTAGGARPGAGRRICPDCGALSVIQQERRARAFVLDCGHVIYELGEPTETTNPQAPIVQSIWDAYRDRHLRLPDGTAATLVTLGVTADVDAGIAYFRVAGEPQLRRLGLDELDQVTTVAGRANQLDWADAASEPNWSPVTNLGSEWADQIDAPLNTESGPINLIGPPDAACPEPPVVEQGAWPNQLDWPAAMCVCGQPAIRGAPEGAVCGRCILYRVGGAVGTWPLPAGDIPATYGTAADD